MPLVYEFEDDMTKIRSYYLASDEEVAAAQKLWSPREGKTPVTSDWRYMRSRETTKCSRDFFALDIPPFPSHSYLGDSLSRPPALTS